MADPTTNETTTHTLRRIGGWAGILGPVLFTLTFWAQEIAHRGEYSPVEEPVSALEAGPFGWVQQLNFVVLGTLTILWAIGMHVGVRKGGTGIAGPLLLAISGVGALIAAAIPLQQDATGVTYDPGGHVIGGALFFMTGAVGLVVLSRRLHADPHWARLSRYALAAGLVALASNLVTIPFVLPDQAPLHDIAGLVQRLLVLVVLFPCRVVLGRHLLRASPARDPHASRILPSAEIGPAEYRHPVP